MARHSAPVNRGVFDNGKLSTKLFMDKFEYVATLMAEEHDRIGTSVVDSLVDMLRDHLARWWLRSLTGRRSQDEHDQNRHRTGFKAKRKVVCSSQNEKRAEREIFGSRHADSPDILC